MSSEVQILTGSAPVADQPPALKVGVGLDSLPRSGVQIFQSYSGNYLHLIKTRARGQGKMTRGSQTKTTYAWEIN